MARALPLRVQAGWDPQFTRMIGLSAAGHVLALVLVLFVVPLIHPTTLPIVAYTVELTDPSALGGALPPGRPDQPLGPRPGSEASTAPAARAGDVAAKTDAPPKVEPPPPTPPVASAPAPEPPKPVEPKLKLPEPTPEPPPQPKPEAKLEPKPEVKPEVKPEPKPEVKPEPKPEVKPEPPQPKPEAKKPEPKPEPSKPVETAAKPPAPKPVEAKPTEAKPADTKPAAEAKPAGKPGGKPEATAADGGATADPYAAAAAKWRSKAATGGGGGLGGTDTSGAISSGGYGPGGGGQVVGLEFLAYQQRVVAMVKAAWVNAVTRPGLVAKVRFSIAPNGEVSGARLEHASGDATFDGSVVRAVQRANPLPPPPARYANEFREFMIEFHSEEGGQAAG